MSATQYTPVTWGDEPVYKDKLLQMTNNDQWLFENTPKVYYNAYGIKKASGVKVMAGLLLLPPSASTYSASTCYFGSFFTPGCKPIITNSIVTMKPYHWLGAVVAISAVGAYGVLPDYRGFSAHLVYALGKGPIPAHYIQYVAVGW